MAIAQHNPVTGLAYQVRPASPESQERLNKQDAALPPELRRQFPVTTRDEIKARYPDKWIALIPTHVDEHDRMHAGRLVAHARDQSEFAEELRRFRTTYPKVFLHTYFTGRYPMGRNAVCV